MRVHRLAATLLLAACNSGEIAPGPSPLPTAAVAASGETVAVATANADAADDPAIWRNPANPAASLIIGTDKKAGLYVYDLDGKVRDFNDAGRVNNVDISSRGGRIIVAASDRNDPASAHIALFSLDPASAKLTGLGRVPAGPGEAYGLCLYNTPAALHAFLVLKDGSIRQLALDLRGTVPTAKLVRTMKLATQSEGCVVDPRTARLYVAEEDVGIWRFDARADGPVQPTQIAAADGKQIVADAEGVAIAAEANGGYLVVSSQGDSAYAIFRLSDAGYAGRFRIASGRYGAAQETHGIEIVTGGFGPRYPAGIMIAQDDINPPRAQNFKLVSWARIKAKLGL